MAFIVISGFYPDSNPDNSIQYGKNVPKRQESAVLAAMGWASLSDIPAGETDLTKDQTTTIMAAFGECPTERLIYSIGLYSN